MNQPRLRFNEFKGKWENKRLGKISRMYDNDRIPIKKQDRLEGHTRYYGANGVQDYVSGFTHDGEYILLAEDETESIDLNKYPIHYVNGKIWVNNHAHVVSGLNGLASNLFLKNCLSKTNWNRYLVAGGGRYKLNAKATINILINLPSFSEQQKIGQFFQNLDQQIELQSDKLESLKQSKQGYLQKMFPKYKNKVPDLRFQKFQNKWVENKIGETFDVVTDYVSNGSFKSLRENVTSYESQNYAYLIRLQDASNHWQGPWLYTDKKGYDFLKKSKIFENDIIMSNVGSVGKFFKVPKLDRPMTLAPNAVLLRSMHNDNNFLYCLLQNNSIKNKVLSVTTPGVQHKINKTDFKGINVLLPHLREQIYMGKFFSHLDRLIDLQQQKVDHLKRQKQAYLQKMFV